MNPPENLPEAPPPSILEVFLSKVESPSQIVDAMRTMDATGIQKIFKLAEQQQPELYVAILREILHRKEEQMPNLLAIVENIIHESLDRDIEFGRMDGTIFLFFLLRQKEKSREQQTLLEPLVSLFQDGQGPLFVSSDNVFFDEDLKTEIRQFHTALRTFAQDVHHAPHMVTPQTVSRLRETAMAFEQKIGNHIRQEFTKTFLTEDAAFVAKRQALYAALGPGKEWNPKAFDFLLKYCASPFPDDKDVPPVSRGEVRRLRNAQSDLLLVVLSQAMESMQWSADKTLDPSQRSAILDPLLTFITEREKLKDIVDAKLPKELLSARGLALVGGLFFNYAFMKGESVARFKRPFSFYKVTAEGFRRSFQIAGLTIRGVDRVLATNMMNCIQRASKFLGSKAPPPPEVFKTIWKSPMGKSMFAEMMSIQSPLTAGFFGIYLHISPNKIKAAIELAGMMVSCAGLNAGARLAYYLLLRQCPGFLGKSALLRLAKFCKHPVGALIVITLVLSGLHEKIEQFISYIDESLPDGPTKQFFSNILSMVGFGFTFGVGRIMRYFGIGPEKVDPETDAMDYLSEERVQFFGRERFWTIPQWNAHVDGVNGEEPSSLKRSLNELHKIDEDKPRAETRTARLWMYQLVKDAKEARLMERELAERSKVTGLNFLEYATQVDDPNVRNDDLVEQILDDNTSGGVGGLVVKAKKYFETQEHDSRYVEKWKSYLALVRSIAKRAEFFQDFGIYDRQKWFGSPGGLDNPATTAFKEEGLPALLDLKLAEWDIYRYKKDGTRTREEFARELAKLSTGHVTWTEWLKLDVVAENFCGPNIDKKYREALVGAAVSAVSYIPHTEDAIDDIFTTLVEYKQNPATRVLSKEAVKRLRDDFADTMILHEESKVANRKTECVFLERGALHEILVEREFGTKDWPLNVQNVFLSFDRRDHPWKSVDKLNFGVLLRYAFGKEYAVLKRHANRPPDQREDLADIVIFQVILPKGDPHEKSEVFDPWVLHMTCIDCEGSDPNQWVVRTYRRYLDTPTGDMWADKDLMKGRDTVTDFGSWSSVHHNLLFHWTKKEEGKKEDSVLQKRIRALSKSPP